MKTIVVAIGFGMVIASILTLTAMSLGRQNDLETCQAALHVALTTPVME